MLSLNGNGANCKVMPTQVSQVLYTFLFLHWLDSIQGRIFIQTLSPLWISCPIFFFMATYSSVPILCLFIFPQEKRRERKISHAFLIHSNQLNIILYIPYKSTKSELLFLQVQGSQRLQQRLNLILVHHRHDSRTH